METLNRRAVIDVMRGATLLASGGGGSLDDGMIMLASYEARHSDEELALTLIQPDELPAEERAIGVAVMGAPSGGTGLDITPCATNAFEAARSAARAQKLAVGAAIPLELGGFNTFVALLCAMEAELPAVDADLCGRAVPALDNTLSHLSGCATSPVTLASVEGDVATITCSDPCDALRAQELAMPIVAKFEQNAGIAGWLLSQEEIKRCVPCGTVTQSRRIGALLTAAATDERADIDIYAHMSAEGIARAERIAVGRVTAFSTGFQGGWDVGTFTIEDEQNDSRWRVAFSNESLLLYQVDVHGSEHLVCTAPDIITLYDADTFLPLTNEDLEVWHKDNSLGKRRVALGVIQAHKRWYELTDASSSSWKPYLAALGYEGELVAYPFA